MKEEGEEKEEASLQHSKERSSRGPLCRLCSWCLPLVALCVVCRWTCKWTCVFQLPEMVGKFFVAGPFPGGRKASWTITQRRKALR